MRRAWIPVVVITALVLLTTGCGQAEPPVQDSGLALLARQADGYQQAQPGQPPDLSP